MITTVTVYHSSKAEKSFNWCRWRYESIISQKHSLDGWISVLSMIDPYVLLFFNHIYQYYKSCYLRFSVSSNSYLIFQQTFVKSISSRKSISEIQNTDRMYFKYKYLKYISKMYFKYMYLKYKYFKIRISNTCIWNTIQPWSVHTNDYVGTYQWLSVQ